MIERLVDKLKSVPSFDCLPNAPGVGYKPCHHSDLMKRPDTVKWLEIHAENYFGDGGRPFAQLQQLSEIFAVSVHGVGLSIGGDAPLDRDHLSRLKNLMSWLQPAQFSEHLAWSTHDGIFVNDLLPLPYTPKSLTRVADHIDHVQSVLKRKMLLENPASYFRIEDSTFSETEFLSSLVKRTGCGLLLDVNNVFVSATNLKTNPKSYVDALPLESISEIHLAGHSEDTDDQSNPVLIDSHDRPVSEPVWALFQYVIGCSGPKPTLIEWDANVPDWPVLAAETARIANTLQVSRT